MEEMKTEYERRREFIVDRLRSLRLDCKKPEGTFYVFPSLKKTGLKAMDFAQRLLKQEKVAVVPGTAFGKGLDDYVRISYASSLDNLKEALARIEKFLGE